MGVVITNTYLTTNSNSQVSTVLSVQTIGAAGDTPTAVSTSDKIALGVGIGIGLPAFVAAAIGSYYGYRTYIVARRA
jgi:hypothetical protein